MTKETGFLFRYRSLEDGADQFVKRTLLDDELYFSAPTSFNDPFDCCPAFDFSATVTEMVNYYERILRRKNPQAPEYEITREALAIVYDPDQNPLREDRQAEVQVRHGKHITETIGVLCLSQTCKEILMWSHYANYHKGICLRFDADHPYFANTHEVQYHTARPRINPFKDTTNQMMEIALLAKAEQWKYEQEWRVICYQGGAGVKQFPPEALTGIVLGAKITAPDEQNIRNWIKNRCHPTQLLRAVQSLTGYSLMLEAA